MPYSRLSHNAVVLDARRVDLTDRLWSTGFASGYGVYETMRIDAGRLRYADEHSARLLHSAHLIDLAHLWNVDQIVHAALSLVESLVIADGVRDFNLRMLLLGAASASRAELWMHAQDRHTPTADMYATGVTACTVQATRYLPLAKSMGQLAAYQAYRSASTAGHYEALLVQPDGLICEGSRSNFVALRDEALWVAPRTSVLGGVTQGHVERIARELGLAVQDGGIYRQDLMHCQAAWLCGTSIGMLPLSAVDGVALTVNEAVALHLQQRYQQSR